MHVLNIATLAFVASLGFGAAAETVRGPELPFGAGTVQSWVKLDGKDRPKQIGFSISEQAVAEFRHDMIFLTVPLPEAA